MIILTGIITNKYLSLASIYKQSNMVNNFLVQRISKGTGSFFASASIAISILSTINLNSSRVLASFVNTLNVPSQAISEMNTITQRGYSVKSVVFPPNGAFGIVYGDNGYYPYLLPQQLVNNLSTINKQQKTINSIVFTPSGQWIVIFDGNGFYTSTNFPKDVDNKLVQINKQKLTINSVAFTPYGGWVIIYGNNRSYSNKIPQSLSNRIADINKANQIINNISFTNNGGWITIYNNGSNAAWDNIPPLLVDTIKKRYAESARLTSVAFAPNNGWVLFFNRLNTPEYQQLLNNQLTQSGKSFLERSQATQCQVSDCKYILK